MKRTSLALLMAFGLAAGFASPAVADPYTLGNLANFRAYTFGTGSTISIASAGTNANVHGNIGVGAGADVQLPKNAVVTVTGQIFYSDAVTSTNLSVNASGVSATIDGKAACTSFATCDAGGRVVASNSTATNAQANEIAMYAAVKSLAATTGAPSGNLSTNFTWTGNGGTNVADLSAINLGNGDTFTLNGTASDFFIVNVTGAFNGSGTGAIVLGANVNPDHVLFNMLCTAAHTGVCSNDAGSGAVSFTGGFTGAGIVLAPDRDITDDTPTGNWTGRLISGEGKTITLKSPLNAGSLVPEPGTLPLMVSGLVAVTLVSARRRRNRRGGLK